MKPSPARTFLTGWLSAFLLIVSGPAQAGGPMVVSGDGRPYAWDGSRPIPYTMDPGPLGSFSNIQATQWVADGFNAWAGAEGVRLSFQPTAPHSTDITGRNILSVLDARPDSVSLVILDNDGSVLDTLFGLGFSDFAAGVGYPELFDARNARILQATAIINGTDIRRYRPEWIRGALIEHELGHFLGLTHSQLNPEVQFDGDPNNDALAPRMSYNEGPNSVPGLHVEDRAWIAALYPRPDAPPTTGAVRGRVLLPDGVTGLQGIQVVARREGDDRATAVSGVSGYRYKSAGGNGSRDFALLGAYELPGLPPGNYRLAVEQLTDNANVAPVHGFLPGGRRFWRETRPLVTHSQEATLVMVAAGQVVEGRDFVLDGPATTPRTVAEVEPNPLPETAQTIELPAIVTGRVGPSDQSLLEVEMEDGRTDAIEDFHRIVVTEPTLLTAILAATNSFADAHLHLVEFDEAYTTLVPFAVASSADRGTPPETLQIRLKPGVYYVCVSSADGSFNASTDYRLTLLATPAPEPEEAASDPPRITFAAISHLTQTGMRVSLQTDKDANAVLILSSPLREFGDPALAREHSLSATGLARATYYFLELSTHAADSGRDDLPSLLVNTAVANSGSSPFLFAGLSTVRPVGDTGREFLAIARIANVGDAAAANVRVTRFALPSGWRYVGPPQMPLDLGAIGSGAYAVLAARVERTSDTSGALDLSIEGTFETLGGSVVGFGR
jgi:hypothetical protein